MELQLFIYKDIALHFYYSKDSFNKGNVDVKNIFIYFPGLPQKIDEDFFAKRIDKNTAFFRVYYYGSLLSGGSFTYENCKKTVELAIEFVKNKKGIKTFDNKETAWNYKNLNIVGYSFAGNPIVTAKITKNDVKNVFLLAPLLFLHKEQATEYLKDEEDVGNFYGFSLFYLGFLKRGYKFAFRGIEDKSWDKYFSGDEPKSLVEMDDNYPNITIFHGKEDKKISYNSSIFFQKEKYNKAELILLDDVEHESDKLFDMTKINKII